MSENASPSPEFFISTGGDYPRAHDVLGLVCATVVHSKSLVGDVTANLKNWTVGGELPGYSRLIQDATDLVIDRLKTQALAKGADGIIGFRLCTTQVSEGAAELIAYGTAVRFL